VTGVPLVFAGVPLGAPWIWTTLKTLADDATNIWDDVPDWGGVGARRLVRSGKGRLGASIWEFQPGAEEYVYHFHYGSDEMLVVLRGTPQVRTKDANLTLREGDVLPLPRGPAGGRSISKPKRNGRTRADLLFKC
jgi:quercetin dioxygenase-like cupin family protein